MVPIFASGLHASKPACVLVHGAWHGAWCWNKVVPLLKERGHAVLTPDLPGHGRDQRSCADIHLSTYVDHIKELIESIKEPVILLGHSMGGVVVSQVAEDIPERIHQLVYVSGFIPGNGGSLVQEAEQARIPSVLKEIMIDEAAKKITLNLHLGVE